MFWFFWFLVSLSILLYVLFVFEFNERFASLVVALAHHFILIGTFGCNGTSDRGVRDLAPFRYILNNVGNDLWIELVFRWLAGFHECCIGNGSNGSEKVNEMDERKENNISGLERI